MKRARRVEFPHIEDLRAALSFDPDTGVFHWTTKAKHPRHVGKVAGAVDHQGYRRISVNGQSYAGHRLAWYYVTGTPPADEIDHINGRRDDNRIANLRLANREINTQNVSLRSDSTSGYMGVSFYKPTGKWKAQIRRAGRTKHLGYHDSPELAYAAYMDAKKLMHPGFARAVIAEYERVNGIGGAVRQPLSFGQLQGVMSQHFGGRELTDDEADSAEAFARAVEAAHGITPAHGGDTK